MTIVRLGPLGAACVLAWALAAQPGAALAQGLDIGQGAAGGGVGGRGMGGQGGTELPGSANGIHYDSATEFKHGVAHLKAGQFFKADDDFAHALLGDPANVEILYMRGQAKAGEGDLKGAERYYNEALKLNALKIPVLRDSALTLNKLGQAAKAQQRFTVLRVSDQACAGTCPQASELKEAVTVVQAALGPAPGARQ